MQPRFCLLLLLVPAMLQPGCANHPAATDSAAERFAIQPVDPLSDQLVGASMETRAAELLADPLIDSVSIAIYRDGAASTGHFGELDQGEGNAPTDDTIYEIASVTKTFTGTLAAQAVVDERFSLDDDIRQFLTGVYPHLEYEGEPIRIRHLLTHTSGLPANNKAMEEVPNDNSDGLLWKRLHEAERDYSKEQFFEHLQEIRLEAPPGSNFLYSNLGTNLMGHLLENVYDTTYDQLLRRYVFDPAGMGETSLHLSDTQRARLANGYNEAGALIPPLPLAEVLWGAEGGIKSTLPDMARYLAFQLESARPAVAESHRPLHQLDQGYWIGYYWWVIDVQNGEGSESGQNNAVSFRHDGGSDGVRNVLIVYPDDELGIYVVTNKTSPTTFSSLSKLVEQLRQDLVAGAEPPRAEERPP